MGTAREARESTASRGPRGRWLAAGLLAATCATAAVAAWGGRGYLEDSWWMWKLGSADRATRVQAAEELAERRCIRAVPRLVDAIAEDPAEDITVRKMRVVTQRCSLGSPLGFKNIERHRAGPLVFALWNMREPAFPALKRCLERERLDLRTRRVLAWLVYERPVALEREP